MWNRLRLYETWIYRSAIAFALLFWLAHVVSLPVEITYDGLDYVDLSDVLGSSRFPGDWSSNRTPLLPLSLKIAFLVLGRQAMTAILVPSMYALGGILLLGASARRVGGSLAGAGVIVLVSTFPTLVTYQHCVLTEAGSFFFISLILCLLLWKPARIWHRTAALSAALAVGYYWRQNILMLAPLIAVLHGVAPSPRFAAAWRGLRRTRRFRSVLAAWPLAANALAVVVVSYLLSSFWSPYLDSAGLRDTALRQGMLRQALLPPEHPFVGENREEYYRAIGSSIYHRNFISGMRWNLMSELAAKIWARPTPKPVPQFFMQLVRENPVRYLNALGRTLVFYAGFNGVESDNRIFRDEVLSGTLLGSKISAGPPPFRSRIQHDFEQHTTTSLVMRFLRGLTLVYDPLLILASALTVLGLVVALWQRNWQLFAFCAVPCFYAMSYAVLLVSLDRFMTPVYPFSLANAILVPLAIYRRIAGRDRATEETVAATVAMDGPSEVVQALPATPAELPLPNAPIALAPIPSATDDAVRWPPKAGAVPIWALGVMLLLLPLHMIAALFNLHHRIPWGDEINLFCATELYNGLSWSKLVAFSNEHRVAFTRMVVFFDYSILHGANIAPYVTATLLALVPPAACYWSFRRLAPGALSRPQMFCAGALLTAIYFNGKQSLTLSDPIMLQHYFVNAFAVLAAWSLSLVLVGKGRRVLTAGLVVFAAALCASFASANGILIIPGTILAAAVFLVTRGWKIVWQRWRVFGFLACASAGIALGYIIPYISKGRLPGSAAEPSVLQRAHFTLLFLGGPFWRDTTWPIAHRTSIQLVTMASLAFAAVTVWVAVQVFRRRAALGRFEAFHIAVMSFVLTTAVVGAFYRAKFGVSQAINERYACTALLFWLSTISLWIRYRPATLFGRTPNGLLRPFAVGGTILVLLLPLHLSSIHTWLWWKDRLSETAAGVGSGMFDYVRVKRLYYDDGEGYQLMSIFRAQQVYFLRDYPLPPYPLTSRYRVQGRSRPGLTGSPQFLNEYPGRSGYIIIGSMPPDAVAAGPLIIADRDDTVVGYGYVSRVPDRWSPLGRPTAWFAAFRNPYGSPLVKIYATRGSDAFELARIAVPPESTGPLAAVTGCFIAGINDVMLKRMNGVAEPVTGAPVVIDQPAPIDLKGWAVDRGSQLPASGLKVFLDGTPYDVPTGYPSPDIAKDFKNPAYATSGFRLSLPTAPLAKGKHNLLFQVATREAPGCRQSGVFVFTLR